MRLSDDAALDMEDHSNQDKRQMSNPEEAEEELYVGCERAAVFLNPIAVISPFADFIYLF